MELESDPKSRTYGAISAVMRCLGRLKVPDEHEIARGFVGLIDDKVPSVGRNCHARRIARRSYHPASPCGKL
jgi:hypothetical protein